MGELEGQFSLPYYFSALLTHMGRGALFFLVFGSGRIGIVRKFLDYARDTFSQSFDFSFLSSFFFFKDFIYLFERERA